MPIDDLIAYIFTPAAQVMLVIGLAEVAKKVGFPIRWIPLLDLGLGIVTGIIAFGLILGYGMTVGVFVGISVGLSACGLFSGVKNTIEKPKEEDDEQERR